jgi:hydrogenase maturation protease
MPTATENSPAILVLGIGNLLRRDEGFGVHVVRLLERRYTPSANVTLLDGGTAGVTLLDAILGCARLVVVDVARMGAPPGTLVRLGAADLPLFFQAKQSAHDWGFAEILLQANLLGHRPEVVVVAVEPQDMDTWTPGPTSFPRCSPPGCRMPSRRSWQKSRPRAARSRRQAQGSRSQKPKDAAEHARVPG